MSKSIGLTGAWAFARSSGRLTLDTKFKLTNRSTYVTVDAIGSGIESLQFYGIGNAALDVGPSSFYRVHRKELGFGVGLGWGLASRQKLRMGVRGVHSVTDPDDQPEPTAPIATASSRVFIDSVSRITRAARTPSATIAARIASASDKACASRSVTPPAIITSGSPSSR